MERRGLQNLGGKNDGDHPHRESDSKEHTKNGSDEDDEWKAANELRLTVRALWKTGLEVFIHQLLYRRGLYPRDSFCSTRFVGVECKINNNPGVLVYIAEALKDVIPLLFGNDSDDPKKSHGSCRLKEIVIEIYDQATKITHEHYSLAFSALSNEEDIIHDGGMETAGAYSLFSNSFLHSDPKSDVFDHVIGEAERELRDLVCSTGKLERPQSLVWDDSVSFKILLKFNQRTNDEPVAKKFDSGLDSTKWSETIPASDYRTGNRVLFNLPNFGCQFQYQLISSRENGQRKNY